MKKEVLFLCTGNYYRSRFAEIYFNYLATKNKLDWQADSRGLAFVPGQNIGAISPFAVERLKILGISVAQPQRESQQVTFADLETADLVVAMYDDEHRPFVQQSFSDWIERIEFWRVPDVEITLPAVALPAIQKQIEILIERLQKSEARA